MLLRKTAAGQAEVASKAHALPPRARSLLIMIDGKRSLDDLRGMLGAQVDEAAQLLLREGLVEALPTEAPRPAPTVPAAAAPVVDVAGRAREAARAVTEVLGPMADNLALRLERCKTEAELQAALQFAVQVLGDAAPRAKAEAFRQRFLGP